MLVLKKVSTKKLAIYISIIILMLAGIGLMLYKNQSSNNSNSPAINDPQMNINPLAAEVAAPGGAAIKDSRGFDLTIFSSEKFKELKENVLIILPAVSLGKRDPFKPN